MASTLKPIVCLAIFAALAIAISSARDTMRQARRGNDEAETANLQDELSQPEHDNQNDEQDDAIQILQHMDKLRSAIALARAMSTKDF